MSSSIIHDYNDSIKLPAIGGLRNECLGVEKYSGVNLKRAKMVIDATFKIPADTLPCVGSIAPPSTPWNPLLSVNIHLLPLRKFLPIDSPGVSPIPEEIQPTFACIFATEE